MDQSVNGLNLDPWYNINFTFIRYYINLHLSDVNLCYFKFITFIYVNYISRLNFRRESKKWVIFKFWNQFDHIRCNLLRVTRCSIINQIVLFYAICIVHRKGQP